MIEIQIIPTELSFFFESQPCSKDELVIHRFEELLYKQHEDTHFYL